MKLFLIRHGQSEANLCTYYTGQTDVALTELGITQAEALQPILSQHHFDKVYSSDLKRARQTCEHALPGVTYETSKLLREFDVGRLAGVQLGSVERKDSLDPDERPDYTDYDGENAKMVCARAKAFLEMLEKEPCEYVAAFSHLGFMNCMIRTILETSYPGGHIYLGNCVIHVMEYDGTKWRLLALNYGVKV